MAFLFRTKVFSVLLANVPHPVILLRESYRKFVVKYDQNLHRLLGLEIRNWIDCIIITDPQSAIALPMAFPYTILMH